MKTKIKELLEYISQSTMSITNNRIKPRQVEKVTYKHPKTGEDTIKSDSLHVNITQYEYDIPYKESTDIGKASGGAVHQRALGAKLFGLK